MLMNRRDFLKAGAAAGALASLYGCAGGNKASGHVVVVGGGFGGATAARYLRRYAPGVRVTLVEPARRFFTCPFSNHYLAGLRGWDSIVHGYGGLRAAGVHVIHAQADDVDADARTLRLSVTASGTAQVPDGGLTVLLPRQEARDIHAGSGRLVGDTLGGDWRTVRIAP